MRQLSIILPFIIFAFFSCTQKQQNASTADKNLEFPVPKNENIQIDGDFEDWNAEIFTEFTLLSNFLGESFHEDDISCKGKLAWKNDGLLIMLDITDNTIMEDKGDGLLKGDCIELFFCNGRGKNNLAQFIIAPGVDEHQKEARMVFWDHRGSRRALEYKMEVNFMAAKSMNGYTAEMLLPFDQVEVKAEKGNTVSLHLNIIDLDSAGTHTKNIQWHYLNNAYLNSFAAYNLALTEKTRVTIRHTARAYSIDNEIVNINIKGLNTGSVRLMNAENVIAERPVKETFEIALPFDSLDAQNRDIEIYNNDTLVDNINTSILYNKYEKTKPYAHEQFVRTMLYQYQLNPPPQNGILFIGTSHIRFWHTLQDDIPGLPVYNNGFGGSQTPHVLHYMDDIVIPYKPNTIVYFEGGNDITMGRHANEIAGNTETFVKRVNEKLPQTNIIILTHPDKLKRDRLVLDTVANLHTQIAEKYDFVDLIDMKDALTNKNGTYYENVLHPDNTHMNQNGYIYFSKPIKEKLMKQYQQ
jgi:lysophospholipase L1-like esterase